MNIRSLSTLSPPNECSHETNYEHIMLDWKGNLINDFAEEVYASSVMQAEALPNRYSCILPKTMNLSSVEIQGDNEVVILLYCLCR